MAGPVATSIVDGVALAILEAGRGKLGAAQSEEMGETPMRWRKAIMEMTQGYNVDPLAVLDKRFDAPTTDEMVVLRAVPFVSLCEHHLMPFTGHATIGYLPKGKVVGLSKLARLVDCYARRFQIQERLTEEIADALLSALQPVGCGCVIVAEHCCMTCRGVLKPGAEMVTSALRGAFRSDASARAEFLALAR